MSKPPVKKVPKHIPTPRVYPPRPPAGPPEVVDPIWLVKAIGLTIVGALFCAYLTLCLLVYQGQWQLVLRPGPANAGITGAGEQVRFGAGETGQPRLTGVWIAKADSRATVLYLPDGSGSLTDDANALRELSSLPVNVLGLDYRGFGASEHVGHPTEIRMQADAEAALDYLAGTRHINVRTIVPYGAGLGGSLAVRLAERHKELPGVMVEAADPDVFALAKADPRSEVVPLQWMFHERFPIVKPLAGLRTPKLLLTAGPSQVALPAGPMLEAAYKTADSPKMVVVLPVWGAGTEAGYLDSVRRFLDEAMPGR